MRRLIVCTVLASACVPDGASATDGASSSSGITSTTASGSTVAGMPPRLDIPYPDAPGSCGARVIEPACILGDLGMGTYCDAKPDEVFEVCDIAVPKAPLAFHPVLWDCQCGDPSDLLIADLDADGTVDVAAACSTSTPRVAVWFGGAERPLACPQLHPVAYRPLALAALDVDRDGHLDIVTASADGDSLSVLRGLGDRTFAPQAIDDATSEPIPEALDAVDADGDGVTDLVVRTRQTAEILLGDGAGGFLSGEPLQYDDWCRQSRVADLDEDGQVDLVVLCDSAFGWYRGDGDGFPGALEPFAESEALAFTLADLNADGILDLLIARDTGLFLASGAGAGGFAPAQPVGPGLAYGDPWLEVAELDGEPGREIMLHASGGKTLLLTGDPEQHYATAAELVHVTEVRHPEIGDFNGDGRGDLVWTQAAIQTDAQSRVFVQDAGVFFMESAP